MQHLKKTKLEKIAKTIHINKLMPSKWFNFQDPSITQLDKGFPLSRTEDRFKKQKGQGLIEYLILVALMGVATIGIVRTLNQTVKSRFANAIYALQGKNQKAKTHALKKEEYQRSDLSNFMSGAASTDKKKKK